MLSIVIPTLNEEKYLPLLLASIKKQGFSDYEIIISDGGSQDRTKEVAREQGCTVIDSSDRKSPAHQRNVGASQAKGETLFFLDADSILPDNFFPAVYQEFLRRKLSAAGFYLKFRPDRPIYRLYSAVYSFLCFFGQYVKPASVGIGMMANREKHEMAKGFDESIFIGEDYDYNSRLARLGRFRMIRSSFLYYSARRLEKEGRRKVLGKWLKGTIYFLFKGPIRKKIVEYNFGGFDD